MRDQVAHMAFWGRDANEIERADIHHGQGLKGSLNRPDTEAQDQLLQTR
jgi:hypothetical protein